MEELLFFGISPFLAKIGCSRFILNLAAVLLSSASVVVFYYINKLGLRWLAKLIKRKSGSSWLEKFCRTRVGKIGYVGLALIYLGPQVPCLRETALATCQGFGLYYTLPVALCFNVIKWFIIFQISS